MLFAEGPICCVGITSLLIIVLGAVLMIGSPGHSESHEYDDDEDETYDQDDDWDDEI